MVRPKGMGEAPSHKDNLIGSAAGGVLKSICLKLVTSSKIALFLLLLLSLHRVSTCAWTTWKLRWTLASKIGLRQLAKRIQDLTSSRNTAEPAATTLSISTQNKATADRKEGFTSDVMLQRREQSRKSVQQHDENTWHPK